MSVSLTSNFFLNARGLTFEDGGGVTWSFSPNTNRISATAASGATGSNPTAKVGLSAVNGSATTFLRSDGAPPIDQAITPTWSGLHTFTGGITVTGAITLDAHTFSLTGNASVSGTNTGDQIIPVGANPAGSVGLSAVNGSAATFMRSDGAPVLSQSIAPTWTGDHTFNGAATFNSNTVTINTSVALALNSNAAATQVYSSWAINGTVEAYIGVAGAIGNIIAGSSANDICIRSNGNNIRLSTNSGASIAATFAGNNLALAGSIGVNGVTPPVQVTGFGTPTGASVVASFSGTAATNAQMQATIAQILTILKANGMIGV